jgi:hypothetical protein
MMDYRHKDEKFLETYSQMLMSMYRSLLSLKETTALSYEFNKRSSRISGGYALTVTAACHQLQSALRLLFFQRLLPLFHVLPKLRQQHIACHLIWSKVLQCACVPFKPYLQLGKFLIFDNSTG